MILATFFQTPPSSGFSSFLIPLGLMFAIMYFMVIMPQQRQRGTDGVLFLARANIDAGKILRALRRFQLLARYCRFLAGRK